jgi:hypothetical protein
VADSLVSLARPGSKAAHYAGVCRVWTLVEPLGEVPVRIAEDRQWSKHTRGPCQVECTTLRREQLDDGSVGPILQGVKADRCLE